MPAFDLNKIRNKISDLGLDEDEFATTLVDMCRGQSVQGKMFAVRAIGDLCGLSNKKEISNTNSNMMESFGVGHLNDTVQERRRIGNAEATIFEEVE
jgi:hypothetical protein